MKNQLKDWINPAHLNKDYKKQFFENKPFRHLEIKDFLNDEKAIELLKALSKEKFYEKDSDLFTFYQTQDIKSSNEKFLLEIRDFLKSKEFIKYMEKITGFKLKVNKIDLAGTLYKNTNYLLCHDDDLEGRKIAFNIYLSELYESDGGALILFDNEKEIKRLYPKFNTFSFFEVSKKSFHEVEEVISEKDRISLGGWLHGN